MDMKDEDSHYNGEGYYLFPSQSSMIKWSQRQIEVYLSDSLKTLDFPAFSAGLLP